LSWRLQPLQLLHRPVQLHLPGHELMQGGAVPPAAMRVVDAVMRN
jgi:hypothetical protein